MSEPGSTVRPDRLRRTLTTPKIMFLVVAGAAPLAGTVATLPLAYAIGNGAGAPAAFAFAGLTLLCFSVGYAAMSRHVVSTGGFYAYMARGLGRPAAVGGGLIAVIAYSAGTVGLVGAVGYFAKLIADSHGFNLPWEVWSGVCVAAMAFFGYRNIEMSARLLAVLTACEIGILALLNVSIFIHRGAAAAPATSFAPHTVITPGLGLGLMFAFMSFTGFESAALYSEEAPDPKRSIARGTYAGIGIIAAFYALTSWTAVGAVGADKVVGMANNELGDFFFRLSDRYLNGTVTTVMQVLLVTSLFGAVLAFHNAANRYMFALGRGGVLTGRLAAVHPRFSAPHRASVVQTAVTSAICAAFALARLDPYVNLATSMLGLATLGIVLIQAGAAASVLGFFRSRPDRHWWRTLLAPLFGLAGLGYTAVLLVKNFALVTGTSARIVNILPWVMLAVAVGGAVFAVWLRSARPRRYASLTGEPGEQHEPPRADGAVSGRSQAPAAPDAVATVNIVGTRSSGS